MTAGVADTYSISKFLDRKLPEQVTKDTRRSKAAIDPECLYRPGAGGCHLVNRPHFTACVCPVWFFFVLCAAFSSLRRSAGAHSAKAASASRLNFIRRRTSSSSTTGAGGVYFWSTSNALIHRDWDCLCPESQGADEIPEIRTNRHPQDLAPDAR